MTKDRYYTTDEACAEIAKTAESGTFSRQAFWVWVGKLELTPWKEHGRKVWWREDAIRKIIAARSR